jgi:methylphosphotriester-DNA--protein-cysteine methyltransferase
VYESKPSAGFTSAQTQNGDHTYMAKKTANKYHRPNCMVLAKAKKKDLVSFGSKPEAEAKGFRPCKICVE